MTKRIELLNKQGYRATEQDEQVYVRKHDRWAIELGEHSAFVVDLAFENRAAAVEFTEIESALEWADQHHDLIPLQDTDYSSKSEYFRKLFDEGYPIADIARLTSSNYSFVYNVLQQYQEYGPPATRQSTGKSHQMRVLHDEGLTVSEIARRLNANYSFVYGVIRRHTAGLDQTINEGE